MASLLQKGYPHTPHARVDQMAAEGRFGTLSPAMYKKIMSLAAVLFVLSLVSFASCWAFLSFISLSHIFAVVLPYFGLLAWPVGYFVIVCLSTVFTLINCLGGLAAGCWAVPILIELPLLAGQLLLLYLLTKCDPSLKARLASQPALPVLHPPRAPPTDTQRLVLVQAKLMQCGKANATPVASTQDVRPVVAGVAVTTAVAGAMPPARDVTVAVGKPVQPPAGPSSC